MLQLKDVTKTYTTAGFTQTALDSVSIAFRDNEFAAVLGPSGSGKTTLLNIIGGLDQYDSGELEIDTISTKQYKDRDWDIYRNNRIGFVFQSYNLIPHQSVLSNVELALTLSGVPKTERRARAELALEQVGLGEHVHKKPNQLSGGQMQRVSIARALINDPEILLADEPTGALDTTTSGQVMELLSEIAKDRLVIMVTHNTELAQRYANRIINLTDGRIAADTNPFDPSWEAFREGRIARKASMSFPTAISLSFSNLMTKKGRTFMTSFAGSIGIIGIAAILALSNGINTYIKSVEEDTLSIYPLTIQSAGLNMASMLTGIESAREAAIERPEYTVGERRIIETVFSSQNNNDLASLKAHFEENKQEVDQYVQNIDYKYNITPQIFLGDTSEGAEQVNPDSILSGYGMGAGSMRSQMGLGGMAGMPGMNVFSEMPGDRSLYEGQYEILTGKWPESYDEAVLVLAPDGKISDFAMYAMGIRDRAEMKAIADSFMNKTDEVVEIDKKARFYSYNELLSVSFKVILQADLYSYDDTYGVWVDKSGDKAYMKSLVDNGISLKIVGIVQPASDAVSSSLSIGINYTPVLIDYLMRQAANTDIVKEQLAFPAVNVISGRTFAEEKDEPNSDFDFGKIISVDEGVFRDVFSFNFKAPSFDLGQMDFSNMSLDMDLAGISMPEFSLGELVSAITSQVQIPSGQLQDTIFQILREFLVGQIDDEGIIEPDKIMANLSSYLASSDVQAMITNQLTQIVDPSKLGGQITEVMQGYIANAMQGYMQQIMGMVQAQMQQALSQASGQIQQALMSSMGDMASQIGSIDPSRLTDAFKIEMDEEEVLELMMSIMSPAETTYEQNLSTLGYANPTTPSSISIYPRDFESKKKVINVLTDYNNQMQEADEEDKVIHYTDIVGVLMSSVTDIVDLVSYALIAFVAISLVVSSIMIGVITFVSVLERKKEIGILRAIGASKGNIRLVFNSETMIIGFIAGVIGVLSTLLISLIANRIILRELGVAKLVLLPFGVPVVLVAISVFLSFIAGLFPASAAARKPPVEALRSE
ncbi:MAG: ABC transporter ATP-binding protein/permease [Eubacteriaceae bacterium]|nr:ABC transporter ATP-binding protein/permease [Eubacteriaceae bacterium]